MPAPLHIPTNTKKPQNSKSTSRVQGGTAVIYRDSWRWEGTHQANFGRNREKYLQAIENTITKIITNHVREVIQKLFENYSQVRQATINEHEQSFKKIAYTLTEPLSTIFIQIQDIRILVRAAKKPYSDGQIVEVAMNIIRNKNDFETVQANR